MAALKVGDRVLVDGEGFEGDIVAVYADGMYLVEMSVVDEDGESYCLKCDATELTSADPRDAELARLRATSLCPEKDDELAALRRANALAVAALTGVLDIHLETTEMHDPTDDCALGYASAIQRVTEHAQQALAAMHAAASADADAERTGDGGAT